MVSFIIPTETFVRLSHAAMPYGSAEFPACQSVRLEYKNGGYYAVASNGQIIAVEYMGVTTEPDCAVNVALDFDIIMLGETFPEQAFTFEWWPEFNALTCVMGLTVHAAPDDVPRFKEWWRIFPASVPSKANGAFYMDGELIAKLARSSPSGLLCFAQYVDRRQTAIVRDLHDPNWIGGFISDDLDHKATPASLPDWMIP